MVFGIMASWFRYASEIYSLNLYISCDIAEQSIEMFVFCDGLLAKIFQKHLQFLYFGVDGSSAQVHVDTEDWHW